MNAPTKYEIMSVEALNTLKDIIKKFDLDKAEPKQKLQGHDTKWEVDGRVFSTRHKNWFLVECKRKGEEAFIYSAGGWRHRL